MALAITNPYEKANSTSIPAYNAGSGANRILVVVHVCFNANPTAISYGGQAMTLSDSQLDSDSWGKTFIWYLLDPPSGSNSFVITGGATAREPFFACVLTGADTTAVGNKAKSLGNSTTASVSLSAAEADSLIIYGVSSGTNTAISASGAGNSLVNEITNSNGEGAMLSRPSTGTGAQTIQATTPNDFWTIVGQEFLAADTTAIKTVDGLAKASVKTINGLAIASVKSIDGLT